MKFALAILAVVAVVAPLNAYKLPAVGDGALAKEMQAIVDLVPINDVLSIVRVYLAKDKQFQNLVSLAQSTESQQLIKDVEAAKELKQLLRFIQKKGLDIFYLINKLNESLRIPPIVPMADVDMEIIGGINGFISDVANVVPIQAILDLFSFKLQHSQVIKDVANEVIKPEYFKFYKSIAQNLHFIHLEKQAARFGVNENSFNNGYPIAVFVVAIKHYVN
ncbi:hypothetical protein ANTQUA_LOCUS1413 [Anthophora quadrimaculata]